MSKSQVTVRLDRSQLARAQKALETDTITETIERALDLVTEKAVHDAILRRFSGAGKKASFAAR